MPTLAELLTAKRRRVDELHRFQAGRTALLVIDMQRGFLEPGSALEVAPGREIIPNIARLIESSRRCGVPVVFTEYVYSANVPCLRGDPFGIEHLPCEAGSETGFGLASNNCIVHPHHESGPNSPQTVKELAPRSDELVVQGHTYDKFYGTPLDLALRSRDIRFLVMTGIVTDVCVNATLMSAAHRDYRVTVATDGVATLWPELQQACFDIWDRKFARLRTTDQIVGELEGPANV